MSRLMIVACAMLPLVAAASECTLRSTTVSSTAAIVERGAVTANIVNTSRVKKCVVSFRARVGTEWHIATGEYAWDGVSDPAATCALATKTAEQQLVESLAPVALNSEQMMICNDSPALQAQPLSAVGVAANLDQFRVHPKYPRVFWHNGTECRWTLDTAFEADRVKTYQGIICKVSGNQWVLVDRF